MVCLPIILVPCAADFATAVKEQLFSSPIAASVRSVSQAFIFRYNGSWMEG